MKKLNRVCSITDENGDLFQLMFDDCDVPFLYVNHVECGVVSLNYNFVTDSSVPGVSVAYVTYLAMHKGKAVQSFVCLDIKGNSVIKPNRYV